MELIILVEQSENWDKNYWPQLNGLRAVAFLLIFFHHLPFGDSKFFVQNLPILVTLSSRGWIGVDIFFVLSAFLITTLLLKERECNSYINYKYFLIRRALRIWPLYLFYVALQCLLHYQTLSKEIVQSLPSILTYTFNFFIANNHNNSLPIDMLLLWSISVEEQFYVVWGFILSKFKFSNHQIFLFLLFCCFLGFLYRSWLFEHTTDGTEIYYNTFYHMDSFLAGIGIALLSKKIDSSNLNTGRFYKLLMILALTLYLFVTFSCPNIIAHDESSVSVMSLVAIAGACFFLSVLKDAHVSQLFSSKPLVKLGEISYGLYIWHVVALNIVSFAVSTSTHALWKIFPNNQAVIFLCAWLILPLLGMALSILLAALSWKLLERPFNTLKQRFKPQV